ncbi:MAG: 16S rRNA (cytidine(1402)-2'-O)-methyltransferase [Acidimicrobiia bacterium]|nr:16S rRNA (cytidine(1402)-2'-O)-methyltransferase [Acidimicrobiia bacterium]
MRPATQSSTGGGGAGSDFDPRGPSSLARIADRIENPPGDGAVSGRLVFCGTPIGNLGDVSERLGATLSDADMIFAEDTRRTAKLLSVLGVSKPMQSFFAGNQNLRLGQLRERLERGETVAVVTDAGMPTVSDPGAEAVAVARQTGAEIDVIPGPSAVTASLAISGFNGDRFVFEGFLPRKQSERRRRLDGMVGEERTIIVFATPHRLLDDFSDLTGALGSGRAVCVARELTKLHQQLWWGTLSEAEDYWSDDRVRGEFTLIIEGEPPIEPSVQMAQTEVERLIGEGESPSSAIRQVAKATGVSRRQLYETVIRHPTGHDSRSTHRDP